MIFLIHIHTHRRPHKWKLDVLAALPLEIFVVLMGGFGCTGCNALVWIYLFRMNRLFRYIYIYIYVCVCVLVCVSCFHMRMLVKGCTHSYTIHPTLTRVHTHRLHRLPEHLRVLDVILDSYTNSSFGRFLSVRRRLLKLTVLVLIVGHICGCIWAYMAYWESEENPEIVTWVVRDGLNVFVDEFKSYLRSFFWTMQRCARVYMYMRVCGCGM
jgi:hypothetical protein